MPEGLDRLNERIRATRRTLSRMRSLLFGGERDESEQLKAIRRLRKVVEANAAAYDVAVEVWREAMADAAFRAAVDEGIRDMEAGRTVRWTPPVLFSRYIPGPAAPHAPTALAAPTGDRPGVLPGLRRDGQEDRLMARMASILVVNDGEERVYSYTQGDDITDEQFDRATEQVAAQLARRLSVTQVVEGRG